MEKKLKDYLHLYMGCEVYDDTNKYKQPITPALLSTYWNEEEDDYMGQIKPILRSLHYATREEREEMIWLLMERANLHLDADARITREEMVDCIESTEPDDNAVCVYFTCRCFEGLLYLSSHSGLLRLYDQDDKEQPVEYNPELIRYQLSCGFDIHGLIDEGLAIDAATL